MAIIGAHLFFWSQEIVQKAGFRGCVIEFKTNRNLKCAYVNLHYENPLRASGGKDVSSTSLNKSELRQTPDGFLKYYLRQPGSDADVAYKFAPTLHLHSFRIRLGVLLRTQRTLKRSRYGPSGAGS